MTLEQKGSPGNSARSAAIGRAVPVERDAVLYGRLGLNVVSEKILSPRE